MSLSKYKSAPLALAIASCLQAQVAAAPANPNDASALLKRANYFRSALIKEQDPETAFYWMREAALKGEPVAQFQLAKMLLEARGAPFDPDQAQEWLKKAAPKEKRAATLLGKITKDSPQPPAEIPKHTSLASALALSPPATARNGRQAWSTPPLGGIRPRSKRCCGRAR